ncbi:hypothetical protein FQA39_LY04240 [Lamprigera yunnana]|nr:hypothetical protein FQA39_LY04240 [Lamprigera yunnana]
MNVSVGLIVCLSAHLFCTGAFARVVENRNLEPINEKCKEGTANELLVGNNNGYLPEDSDETNEVVKCNWEKFGILNKGVINFYKLQRTLEHQLLGQYDNYVATYIAGKVVQECIAVKGDTDGNTCVKVYNCIHKGLDTHVKLLEEEHN